MKDVQILVGKRAINGTLPESFGELTPEEFLDVVRYRCDVITHKTLIEALLPGKGLPQWVVTSLMPYIEYVNSLDEPLDRFIIPKFKLGWLRAYKAPSAMLRNVSLQQFMSIDNFFQFYTTTQRNEFLLKFVACLYLRPSQSFFGKKILDVEAEAKHLQKADIILMLAIYMNWILIKNWLSKTFKFLFASGNDSGKNNRKGTDWLEVFDSFVGEHVADMIAYQKMECMDAFRIMNNKIKEQRKK